MILDRSLERTSIMAVEIARAADRIPLSPISWAAIFASLAVGISVMLLLTLAGVAIGLTTVEPGENPRAITIGAAAWQALSMLIAALVGGYVAARLSGLRRTADGILHGAVAWGATTVLYAALATTAIGTLTAGMFGLLAPPPAERAAPTSVAASGDRDQMQRTLEGMGISADQSRTIVERLSAPAAATGSALDRQQAEQAADAAGTATGWLTATVLLSLILSMIGGSIGAKGCRRINRRVEQYDTPPAATANTTSAVVGDGTGGRILGRPA
jgi:hypothetical protein